MEMQIFSTFEAIWLILTLRHMFNENLGDFPANHYPALEFFFKIDVLLLNFQAKGILSKSLDTPT